MWCFQRPIRRHRLRRQSPVTVQLYLATRSQREEEIAKDREMPGDIPPVSAGAYAYIRSLFAHALYCAQCPAPRQAYKNKGPCHGGGRGQAATMKLRSDYGTAITYK